MLNKFLLRYNNQMRDYSYLFESDDEINKLYRYNSNIQRIIDDNSNHIDEEFIINEIKQYKKLLRDKNWYQCHFSLEQYFSNIHLIDDKFAQIQKLFHYYSLAMFNCSNEEDKIKNVIIYLYMVNILISRITFSDVDIIKRGDIEKYVVSIRSLMKEFKKPIVEFVEIEKDSFTLLGDDRRLFSFSFMVYGSGADGNRIIGFPYSFNSHYDIFGGLFFNLYKNLFKYYVIKDDFDNANDLVEKNLKCYSLLKYDEELLLFYLHDDLQYILDLPSCYSDVNKINKECIVWFERLYIDKGYYGRHLIELFIEELKVVYKFNLYTQGDKCVQKNLPIKKILYLMPNIKEVNDFKRYIVISTVANENKDSLDENNIDKYISIFDKESAIKSLKEQYPNINYDNLMKRTIDFVGLGEVSYKFYKDINSFDYSGATIYYSKAGEYEIRNKIIAIIQKNKIVCDYLSKCGIEKRKFLGYITKIKEEDKNGNLIKYIYNEVFKNKIEYKDFYELIDLIVEFTSYRNSSSHPDYMKEQTAEKCKKIVLDINRILEKLSKIKC